MMPLWWMSVEHFLIYMGWFGCYSGMTASPMTWGYTPSVDIELHQCLMSSYFHVSNFSIQTWQEQWWPRPNLPQELTAGCIGHNNCPMNVLSNVTMMPGLFNRKSSKRKKRLHSKDLSIDYLRWDLHSVNFTGQSVCFQWRTQGGGHRGHGPPWPWPPTKNCPKNDCFRYLNNE